MGNAREARIESSKLKIEAFVEASKIKVKAALARTQRYKAKNVEGHSSTIMSFEYSIASLLASHSVLI